MVDTEKRYFAKSWKMHDDTKMIKHYLCDVHLPHPKQVPEHSVPIKHSLPRQPKRYSSNSFLPIVRNTSARSTLTNGTLLTTNIETTPPPITYNSSVYEAAQRFILRNTSTKFSREPSAMHATHSFHSKRTTLYNHIQAKIDTGLPRLETRESPEPYIHQSEPLRPVNWSRLKHEIEQDIYIRAHSKRIQFNSNIIYATQITALGNLIRSKIKSHLTSTTGSGDERYKIVVHLTVFPTIAGGLHVASRCLWDARTDNCVTIKFQGVDCDILIVAFLCYTGLGAI